MAVGANVAVGAAVAVGAGVAKRQLVLKTYVLFGGNTGLSESGGGTMVTFSQTLPASNSEAQDELSMYAWVYFKRSRSCDFSTQRWRSCDGL